MNAIEEMRKDDPEGADQCEAAARAIVQMLDISALHDDGGSIELGMIKVDWHSDRDSRWLYVQVTEESPDILKEVLEANGWELHEEAGILSTTYLSYGKVFTTEAGSSQ